MTAFSRYGFARTTIEDIAKASGVPRTALYRKFRNKEDVFRALAQAVHTEALARAMAELDGAVSFGRRLENALIARDLHLLQVGHSGPHADEIAELYLALAKDLAALSNKALEKSLTRATEAAIASGAFQLKPSFRSPKVFVQILRLGLEGVKKEVKSPTAYEKLARQMIKSLIA